VRLPLTIILTFFILAVRGQSKLITYSNDLNAYYNKSNLNTDAFLELKINEITLNTDSTFEFWSRPNVSCFTWHQYKGTWKKVEDTVLFYDNYEVVENDMRAAYKKDGKQRYHISFSTDKNSGFRNKDIKIQYVYDYNAHLGDIEKTFYLNANNVIEIPFQDIPNLIKLAAIKIEYQLSSEEKRFGYLTENKFLNIKNRDLPNIIGVEFVETPKTEIVHRTIKGIIRNNALSIISTIKTQTTLPDYHDEIMFENSYTLNK